MVVLAYKRILHVLYTWSKTEVAFPRVYTQLWYCLKNGTPIKLKKNTRRIDLESAIETWHELLTQDGELMEHQINEDAA